jgi:D-erythrulose 1-phosphate 3-epimerase
MTTFTLGINTCFAVKRWPRPEEWARIVSEDLGLTSAQHSLDLADLDAPDGALDRQAAEVREACADVGVALTSTFTGLMAYSASLLLHPDEAARERAMDWYHRLLRFSATAGAARAGGHIGSLSVADHTDPVQRARRWEGLRAALDTLAARARELGLGGLLIENMASPREPSTMADMRALLTPGDDRRAPVQLCLDVGHQCVPGTTGEERDPYAWLRALGASAPVVHLQQTDAEGDHHWPFTPPHNDAARVLDSVAASGAEHVELVLEVIPPFEQDDAAVLDDLRASVEHWRRALADSGSGA